MDLKSYLRKLIVTVGVGPRGDETRELSFSEEEVEHLRRGKELNDEVADLKDQRWVKWRKELAEMVGINSDRYKCIVLAFRYVFSINLPEANPREQEAEVAPVSVVAAAAARLVSTSEVSAGDTLVTA